MMMITIKKKRMYLRVVDLTKSLLYAFFAVCQSVLTVSTAKTAVRRVLRDAGTCVTR